MRVYVIGHKNPDTDAICAAIGYADLLRKTSQPDAVAAACGAANLRTRYVLQETGLPHPEVIMDVRPTAGELCHRQVYYARLEEPFLEVYRRMQQHKLKTIPIIDGDHHLIGMVPLLDLMQLLLPDRENLGEQRLVDTSLMGIRNVLGGRFVTEMESARTERLFMMVGAMSLEAFTQRLHQAQAMQTLIVAGDRPTIQAAAIDYGVRALVITGGYPLSEELNARARHNRVTVISSPLDTAMTTLLIKSARRIDAAVSSDYMTFNESMRLQELRMAIQGLSQDLFPVVDSTGKLEGVLTKSDLLNPEPARLILVDHNEFSQAVNGAKEARILEVIDHHRVGGGLTSNEPIRFFNDPVGSTCTLITRMFRQQAIIPDPAIALCLAAGIISDTLFLRSPTTTEVDRDMLAWLESYARTDLKAFSLAFFAAGSSLRALSPKEVLASDRKQYEENGWTVAISQVEELDMDTFWERKQELHDGLRAFIKSSPVDLACLLVTDITKESSLLLVEGRPELIKAIEYPGLEENLFDLPGVVSRKKQLLPQIMWLLQRVTAPEQAGQG